MADAERERFEKCPSCGSLDKHLRLCSHVHIHNIRTPHHPSHTECLVCPDYWHSTLAEKVLFPETEDDAICVRAINIGTALQEFRDAVKAADGTSARKWNTLKLLVTGQAALADAGPHGTFSCPICGVPAPHTHNEKEICNFLEVQASRFGIRAKVVTVYQRLNEMAANAEQDDEIFRLKQELQRKPQELNFEQEKCVKLWAADDNRWTTQETVEANLRTFARKVLREADARRAPKGEKRPINRPCSACGDGDIEMEYHDHFPPFADEDAGRAPATAITCTTVTNNGPFPLLTADPFSKGYKHRHGEPVSDACGDGHHAECTQDLTKCHCTVRSGHTVMHAYGPPTATPPPPTRIVWEKKLSDLLHQCRGALHMTRKLIKSNTGRGIIQKVIGDLENFMFNGGWDQCRREWLQDPDWNPPNDNLCLSCGHPLAASLEPPRSDTK